MMRARVSANMREEPLLIEALLLGGHINRAPIIRALLRGPMLIWGPIDTARINKALLIGPILIGPY